MSKINKILVTGATGFVGANLVRKLVNQNYQIHIITRSSSNKWRIKNILSKVKEHSLDLTKKDKLERLIKQIKPEVIFHLAAAGIFGGVEASRKKLIESNFLGTINLIDACSNIDYKCFINTGSSSEYGPKNKPMKETDICQPINFYGITKLATTSYGNLVGKAQQKPIINLRLFSPFGPFDDINRLITYVIVNAIQNKDLNLANPKGIRDFVYIEDVVNLYIKAMSKVIKDKGAIFNVGSGKQITVLEIVNKIIELTNSRSKINWNSQISRPWDTKKWQADIKETSRFFNWHPQYSINQGLKESITWFKKNLLLYK